MTRDKYCLEICRGKCCILYPDDHEPVRCPRLQEDGSCSIYKERYAKGSPDLVLVGSWLHKTKKTVQPFWCGRILDIIEKGELREEVAEGCCYANPKLLTIKRRK